MNTYETKNLKLIQCSLCGCNELVKQGDNTYYCKNCKAIYSVDDYEKILKDFNLSIYDTVSGIVKQELDVEKSKQIGNARFNLYKELKEEYLSSKKIIECAKTLKDFLPDDVLANFFYNIENPTKLSKVMEKIPYNDLQTPQKNLMIEFLLKSTNLLERSVPTELNELIDTYRRDSKEWITYYNKYKCVMEKVNSGFFDVNLPRDIFIAYSSKDKEKVKEIVELLENNDFKCFVAFRNLFHGSGAQENYQEYLRKAMDNCSIFMFISSSNSRTISCEAVKIEMEYIKNKDKDNLPPEMRNIPYSNIDLKYKKPRIEFIIEDYNGMNILGEDLCNEFFGKIERVYDKKQLLIRSQNVLQSLINQATITDYGIEGRLTQEQIKLEEIEKKKKKQEQLKLEEKRKVNLKYCSNCGAENDLDVKFCGECGNDTFLTYNEIINKRKEEERLKTIKICKKCGYEVKKEKKFCTNCGNNEFYNTREEYERDKSQNTISVKEDSKFKVDKPRKQIAEEKKLETENKERVRENELKEAVDKENKKLENENENNLEHKDIIQPIIKPNKNEVPKNKRECVELAYKNGTTIKFGEYSSEFIEWEVKDIKGNKALLVTKNIVEAKRFSTKTTNYKNSEIRKWLNKDFYNIVFNNKEKDDILSTKLTDMGIIDKVFLLSDEEIEKYYGNFKERVKQGTQHSKDNGLWVSSNETSYWWLRSAVDNSSIYNINDSGYIYNDSEPTDDSLGVVCSIMIDLSKLELEKYEEVQSENISKKSDNKLKDDIENAYKENKIIEFGKYNNKAIKWEVKEIKDNKALLVTKYIIEAIPFSTMIIRGNYCNEWGNSEIRKWLNESFYNTTFTSVEKERIQTTELKDVKTNDKIFLLSNKEVLRYFKTDKERKKQGIQPIKNLWINQYNGKSCWWLRSSSKEYHTVYGVDGGGNISPYEKPNLDNMGIVCAMNINLL